MAETTTPTPTKRPSQTFVGASKVVHTDFPLIDNDPCESLSLSPADGWLTECFSHFKRVVGYARTSDYVAGGIAAAFAPSALLILERFAPSHVGRGGFPKAMRLAGFIGIAGGFLYFYQRSCLRFYGATENSREIEMDMREMVDKVKAGQPLYGESKLSPHMQGVAARQSRYSALFFSAIPWFNIVNHSQHGVDTAKYYQQAERELEMERTGSNDSL